MTLAGWVVDTAEGTPPASVSVALPDDTVVGTVEPTIARPDVAEHFDLPNGINGFQITVGLTEDEDPSDLRIEVDDPAGASVGIGTVGERAGSIGAYSYHLDSVVAAPVGVQGLTRVQLDRVPRVSEDWLVLDTAGAPSAPGLYEIADTASFDAGHVISFDTVDDSPDVQGLRLDSCAQWHGYGPVIYWRGPDGGSAPSLAEGPAD